MKKVIIFILTLLSVLNTFIACDSSARSEKKIAGKENDTIKPEVDSFKISKNFLLGKFSPASDTTFIVVEPKISLTKTSYLKKEAYSAFIEMRNAAAKEGIELNIVSATRTFEEQKKIWEKKFTGSALYYGKNLAKVYPDKTERARFILNYSSMPGTSRHHWGTDIDINSVQNSYFETKSGKKVYDWLKSNAAKYGFCQPYNKIDSLRPAGHSEEKWHWSYIPLSVVYLKAYNKHVSIKDISGFIGAETTENINIIQIYVNGINKNCCK